MAQFITQRNHPQATPFTEIHIVQCSTCGLFQAWMHQSSIRHSHIPSNDLYTCPVRHECFDCFVESI